MKLNLNINISVTDLLPDIKVASSETGAFSTVHFEKKFRFWQADQSITVQSYQENGKQTACFTEINDREISLSNAYSEILFAAEKNLRQRGFEYFSVFGEGGTLLVFPCLENFEKLPQLSGQVSLLCELSRYDGPISGLVEFEERLFWFDWCMESLRSEVDLHSSGRIFFAREIPSDQVSHFRNWATRYKELNDEYKVVANPDLYPVLKKQKLSQRPLKSIEEDIVKLHQEMPSISQWAISTWFTEPHHGFSAIEVTRIPHLTSEKLDIWQKKLAHALDQNNFDDIRKLISGCPIPVRQNDIFRVRHLLANGTSEERLCDFQGNALNDDFIMIADHCIQDLTPKLN